MALTTTDVIEENAEQEEVFQTDSNLELSSSQASLTVSNSSIMKGSKYPSRRVSIDSSLAKLSSKKVTQKSIDKYHIAP